MGTSPRQKSIINGTFIQMELTYIHTYIHVCMYVYTYTYVHICTHTHTRAFHPKTTEYTFLSIAYEIFSRIDHVRPQISLNKFKKTEIISSVLLNHNGMKLEIITRRKLRNSQICGN